jgi:hypothetical protein
MRETIAWGWADAFGEITPEKRINTAKVVSGLNDNFIRIPDKITLRKCFACVDAYAISSRLDERVRDVVFFSCHKAELRYHVGGSERLFQCRRACRRSWQIAPAGNSHSGSKNHKSCEMLLLTISLAAYAEEVQSIPCMRMLTS